MRPSSMGLAAKCPYSVKLNSYGSEQSLEGTAFHEAAKAKVLNEPIDYELLQMKYGLSYEAMKDIRIGAYNLNITIPDGAIIHAEEFIRSEVMDLGGTPDLWLDFRTIGGIDCTMYGKNYHVDAFIVDWKNGRMDIDSPLNNNQLLTYSTIIFENNPDIESMILSIMLTKKNDFKEIVIDRNRIMQIRDTVLMDIIARSKKTNPEIIRGGWCRECFNGIQCPAFAGQYLTLANHISPKPNSVDLSDDRLKEALCTLLPIAKRASSVADGLTELAKAYVDRFGSLDLGDGTRFCKVASTRKKLNPGKAMPILREYFEEDSNKLINLSASKIYDMARAKSKGLNKEINIRLEEAGAFTEETKTEYRMMKQVEEIKHDINSEEKTSSI